MTLTRREAKQISKWSAYYWSYLTLRVGKDGSNPWMPGGKQAQRAVPIRKQANAFDKKRLRRLRRRASREIIAEALQDVGPSKE